MATTQNTEKADTEGFQTDVYVVSVVDSESDELKQKKDAFIASSEANAKHQAKWAQRDWMTEPTVFYCEKVAEDV